MQRSFRHKAIIHAVTNQGAVSVADLVELTGASAITVRRDLAELEAAGAVARTHGGATRPAARGRPMPFSVRWDTDAERKQALGAAAAALVADDEALVLDNGTTCFAVAEALAGRPVTVMALSLRPAAALAARPGATVLVPGGPVETDSLAFVSASAVDAVHGMRADVAVLGACSAAPAHGLTSTTYDDARIKRAALAVATRRVLVATADKLVRTSTFRFGDLEDLTHLVTTADAPPEALDEFRAAGVDVHLTA